MYLFFAHLPVVPVLGGISLHCLHWPQHVFFGGAGGGAGRLIPIGGGGLLTFLFITHL